MADAIEIGRLRWPVMVYRRDQANQGSRGAGIDETLTLMAGPVYACIEFLRPVTFWTAAGQDIGTEFPITHMIWMRWIDYPPTTWVVQRATILPGSAVIGSTPNRVRLETYRVRRVTEMGGRKRMLQIEAELERADE